MLGIRAHWDSSQGRELGSVAGQWWVVIIRGDGDDFTEKVIYEQGFERDGEIGIWGNWVSSRENSHS